MTGRISVKSGNDVEHPAVFRFDLIFGDKQVGVVLLTIEERPGWEYSWEGLAQSQTEMKKIFGDQRAYEDPDYDSEFNTWD